MENRKFMDSVIFWLGTPKVLGNLLKKKDSCREKGNHNCVMLYRRIKRLEMLTDLCYNTI